MRMDVDRETGAPRVWVAVGTRYRRLPLTVPEAWALFRHPAEALDTAGDLVEQQRLAAGDGAHLADAVHAAHGGRS